MNTKPEIGTILFEVALLTVVVFLVDEWLIRGALAFIPAMLLAQRALDTTKASDGFEPVHGGQPVGESIDKLLSIFREFSAMCKLVGSGGITSEDAQERTQDLEKDLNRLLDEVKGVSQQAAAASPAVAGASPVAAGVSPAAVGASPEGDDASEEETGSMPEVAAGLPTL